MLKEEETNTEKMWKVSPGKKQNIPIRRNSMLHSYVVAVAWCGVMLGGL